MARNERHGDGKLNGGGIKPHAAEMISAAENVCQTLQLARGRIRTATNRLSAPAAHTPDAARPAKTCEACPGSVPEAEARQICSSGHVPGPSAARPFQKTRSGPGPRGGASDDVGIRRHYPGAGGRPARAKVANNFKEAVKWASDRYPRAAPARRPKPRAIAADFRQCRMFRES